MPTFSEHNLSLLFQLCERLYGYQLERAGMAVMEFAWAANEEKGELLIFSAFSRHSRKLAAQLNIPILNDAPGEALRHVFHRLRTSQIKSISKSKNATERVRQRDWQAEQWAELQRLLRQRGIDV